MAMKYKTNIEITSEAANRDEAMEIVEDYLDGNIISGIEMKCTIRPVHFYNHAAAKMSVVALLVTIGFLSGMKAKNEGNPILGTCQMAAVQPPLKTSDKNKNDVEFKKEWENKQTKEALSFIKK